MPPTTHSNGEVVEAAVAPALSPGGMLLRNLDLDVTAPGRRSRVSHGAAFSNATFHGKDWAKSTIPFRGTMRWHGPQTNAGEMRVFLKAAHDRLKKAEAAMQRRIAQRESAQQERDEYFGQEAAEQRGQQIAVGLSFKALDELRTLRLDPPPIVRLVMRCVATLVFGDDVVETKTHAEAMAIRGQSSWSRGTGASSVSPSTPRAGSVTPPGGGGRVTPRAGGGSFTPRGGGSTPRAASSAGSATPRGGGGGDTPRFARPTSASVGRRKPLSQPAAPSEVRLLDWEDTLALMREPNFKFRLIKLNAYALLDNPDLITSVEACLDLSNLALDADYTVKPGPHVGDRERRERRLRVSAAYREESEVGVAREAPLTFEEARFAHGVAGAMLVWIQRLFAQIRMLVEKRKDYDARVEACDTRVIVARRAVDVRREEYEQIKERYDWAPRMRHYYQTPYHEWDNIQPDAVTQVV